MPPSQQARINLHELKAKLSKVLGPDKESQYFSIFSRFLSHRLTKSELDHQVLLTIGQENVALHNQLVKAILFNAACSSDRPPLPPLPADTSKPVKGIRRKPLTSSANSGGGGDDPLAAARSNGDALVPSPRKNRTGVRKAKERQSLLGFVKSEDVTTISQESDGFRAGVDLLRPLQHESAEQPDTDSLGSVSVSLKRPRLLPVDSSLRTSPPSEELDDFQAQQQQLLYQQQQQSQQQQECTLWNAWLVRPPLGTPFCVGSIGGSQRRSSSTSSSSSSSRFQPHLLAHSLLGDSLGGEECLDAGDLLPDAEGMRRRMEHVALVEQGLQGVSQECGNLLNQAMDIYLKRLISASVGFVQSRRREKHPQQHHHHHHHHQLHPQQQQLHQAQQSSLGGFDMKREAMLAAAAAKIHHGVNGVWPASPQMLQQHHQHQQMNLTGVEADEKTWHDPPVSALDFKVAMESNPQLLGENRSLHLERLLLRVFEQQQQQVLH